MTTQTECTPLEALPTPLVRSIHAWQDEDANQRPFRAVHRLIDAVEVLCKLYTVAGVSQFVDVLGQIHAPHSMK